MDCNFQEKIFFLIRFFRFVRNRRQIFVYASRRNGFSCSFILAGENSKILCHLNKIVESFLKNNYTSLNIHFGRSEESIFSQIR
ncbi:hypothetical protein B6D60_05700 [candidate division KSB1 bacterium 4484_87]|nr:MAG: hypothetical protein B6D60_05700 [candidate division KSB1 bacterium 4484_87]